MATKTLALLIFLHYFISSNYFIQCEDQSFSAAIDLPTFSTSVHNITSSTRYLIYDVNPGEGFNLRRDVYVRVANLVKHMNDRGEDWILVLPPWRHLYHWRSRYLRQEASQWRYFFDLSNMNIYVPVMEFEDFWDITGSIDQILYLQRHPDQFKSGFKEMVNFDKCQEKETYREDGKGRYRGYFWSIEEVFANKHNCLSVQGHCTVLADFLKKLDARSVLIERFEQVLHVNYGSVEFFKARRSLVFAKHLREEADKFRAKFLNSNDKKDKTEYNDMNWVEQVPEDGQALGGSYLGLHMRRGDYTYAHKATIPSIEELGMEVKNKTAKFNLKKVYVSTDGTDEEIEELQSYFDAKIFRFPRPKDVIAKYRDGGVAIIDQWIVAHARYFIGSCGSTFSFRIHEERDILGFNEDNTYNCICGEQSPEDRCHPPTRWRVKFK